MTHHPHPEAHEFLRHKRLDCFLTAAERQCYNRWLTANAVIAGVFAATLFGFAVLAGTGQRTPETADARQLAPLPVTKVSAGVAQPADIVPLAGNR